MSMDPSLEAAQASILERLAPPEEATESVEEVHDETEEQEAAPEAFEGDEGAEATEEEAFDPEEGEEAEGGEEDLAAAGYDPAQSVECPDGETRTLKDLYEGHLRHSDYTQKTQAVAEERKAVGEQTTAMEAAVQYLQRTRQELEGHLARFRPDPQRMAELQESDPGQFALMKMQEQERTAQLAEAAEMEQQAQSAIDAQRIPGERTALAAKNPAFAGDKFDTEYAALGQWVVTDGGMAPETWGGLVDHNLINLVWKAREYDRTARKAPKLRKKIKGLPKVVRPSASVDTGHSRGRQERAAMERLQKDGSVDAAAAAILARRQGSRR